MNPPSPPPFGTFAPSPAQSALLALARVPPLYRGHLRDFWTRTLQRLRPGPLDVEAPLGGRFRVDPSNNLIERGILLHPRYNAREIAFLREGLPRAGVFLDIGANVGLYTVAVGRHVPEGTVIAIEPSDESSQRLRFNLQCNGMRWAHVVQCGVADYTGHASLRTARGDLAIVQTVRDEGGGIEMKTLLDAIAPFSLRAIHALKIDIEDGEMAALAPFFASAPQALWPARLSIEHTGSKADVWPMLERAGYRLRGKTRSNALYERVSS